MSLINKVLRDLEDREAFLVSPQDGVIGDLRSAQDFAHITARKRQRLSILFAGMLLLAVVVFALNQYRQYFPMPATHDGNGAQTTRNKTIPQSPRRRARLQPGRSVTPRVAIVKGIQNSSLALKLDAKPLQLLSEVDARKEPVAEAQPALLAVQQQGNGSTGHIDLRFSSPPQYDIHVLENPERLLVVLPGASIPPDRFSHFQPAGMISGIKYVREDEVNKVIFEMTRPVVMKSADVNAGTGGLFDIHITYAAVDAATAKNSAATFSSTSIGAASPDASKGSAVPPGTNATLDASNNGISPAARATAGDVIKAAVTPAPVPALEPTTASVQPAADDSGAAMVNVKQQSSENEHAQRLYRDGVADFYRRKYARAISALQEVLQISPTYLEARQLLVSILIDQGDRKDAARVLEKGLEYHPNDPTLIKMNARMLYQDGELRQAMQMLAHIKPQLQDDPEYYALLAAILQKGRDYTRAGEIYQKLVNFNPGNGVWWAGLGISLDGVGRGAQALQAFKKAAADPSIPTGLRDYLSTRIKALAKAPA